MVLLLHSGRCYEAEICVILFLLRCPFIWYPFGPKSKFSFFGQKPWTIIRRFDFRSPKKVLIKVCHSKELERRNLMALVSVT